MNLELWNVYVLGRVHLLNLGELLAKLEVTRAAEISHHSLEGMEIEHIVGDSLELLEEGIIRRIVKELCAHTCRYLLR